MRAYSQSQGKFIETGGTPQVSTPNVASATPPETTGGGIDSNALNTLFAGLIMKNPKQTTALSAVHGLLTPKEKSVAEKARETAKSDADRIITQLENKYFANKLHYGNNVKGMYTDTLIPILDPNDPYTQYKSSLESDAPFLAKAAGDVGNIALAEQIKATKPFPTARSDKNGAITRFNDIREKFGLPKRDYSKTNYAPKGLNELGGKYGL